MAPERLASASLIGVSSFESLKNRISGSDFSFPVQKSSCTLSLFLSELKMMKISFSTAPMLAFLKYTFEWICLSARRNKSSPFVTLPFEAVRNSFSMIVFIRVGEIGTWQACASLRKSARKSTQSLPVT
jgi:hypothetical protein